MSAWVDVVFAQGDDYTKIADMGVDEMAFYLAQWDYGQETDDAHTRSDGPSFGSDDRVYQVRIHDIEYTLSVNHPMGYAGLSRPPVRKPDTDTEEVSA